MHFGYGICWSMCTLGFQMDWTDGFLLALGFGPFSFALYIGDNPPDE